ncbi:hypothetical protein HAX54_017441 [Datura stramonium]|uniref:Uncharacterized protein n=1 Tax=Datura stramonium TaxID=4076 RepID=A0ABS8UN06_DATST|nr:hypothetical protein [Datura stramonium]
MEAYYLSFKKNRSISAEAQFEVASFKDDFPDIYNQLDIHDWGPFTIPVGLYFPKFVWEFYASYWARQSIFEHRDRVDAMSCLPFVLLWGQEVSITVEAINSIYWADPIRPSSEFKRKVEDKENLFKLVAKIISQDQPQ